MKMRSNLKEISQLTITCKAERERERERVSGGFGTEHIVYGIKVGKVMGLGDGELEN